MKALICDLCNGPLTIEAGGEFAVCEYCGVKYSMERLRQKVQAVTGTVEVVTGSAELERLCENAETLLRLGEYKRALDVFTDLTKQFPGDWRGWWGIVRLPFVMRTIQRITYALSRQTVDCLKNACTLCPDPEIIRNFFRSFWQSYGTEMRKVPLSHTTLQLYGYDDFITDRTYLAPGQEEVLYTADPFSQWLTMAMPADQMTQLLQAPDITDCFCALAVDYEQKLLAGEIVPAGRLVAQQLLDRFPALSEKQNQLLELLSAENGGLFAKLLCADGRKASSSAHANSVYPSLSLDDRVLDIFMGVTMICGSAVYFATTVPYDDSYIDIVYLNEPVTRERLVELQKVLRQEQGLCRHCGGEFRGLFRQKCEKCGKPKDY